MKAKFFQMMMEVWWFLSNLMTYITRVAFRPSSLPKSQNKTLIILGNGPSLKSALEFDMNLLQSNECMVVNKFSLSNSYEIIKPGHYVFLDPLFFHSDHEASNLEPKVVADIRSTFEAIATKTTWPIKIYVPYKCRHQDNKIKELAQKNGLIQIIHYHTNNYDGQSAFIFYRNNAGIAGGMNVIHACLALALQMGYKQIALLGADHTWHEQIKYDAESKELVLEDSHYSGTTKRTFSAMKTSMSQEMFCLYKCFESYGTYNKWAKITGSIIINCTPYTYIDDFRISNLNAFIAEQAPDNHPKQSHS